MPRAATSVATRMRNRPSRNRSQRLGTIVLRLVSMDRVDGQPGAIELRRQLVCAVLGSREHQHAVVVRFAEHAVQEDPASMCASTEIRVARPGWTVMPVARHRPAPGWSTAHPPNWPLPATWSPRRTAIAAALGHWATPSANQAMNPMSSMRSASSRTNISQPRPTGHGPDSSRSIKRPGVATKMRPALERLHLRCLGRRRQKSRQCESENAAHRPGLAVDLCGQLAGWGKH